jgi:hypothetical protein
MPAYRVRGRLIKSGMTNYLIAELIIKPMKLLPILQSQLITMNNKELQ